ncbi:ribonuclease HII [Halalkalibacterium halodurans]|uniref:ribonuclease HII n=1 Tax=Halalkalibacterium halodurans TaxID=86665 RepID=UPI002E1FDAC5|nr:ribonuclease HII [Halalkalibacterium halodurans]MED3646691.1 ribonuclease HII [Halalkalibacterium halodurans]
MSKRLSIKEIDALLRQGDASIDETFLAMLKADERKGVQSALKRYERQLEKEKALWMEHEEMLAYEKDLWAKGYEHVAGLDEVGRGPLAGPVVTAAVILPKDVQLPGLTDSKKLAKETRESFYDRIKEVALAWSVAIVPVTVIDEVNIYQATKQGMMSAINQLSVNPDALLLDAMNLPLSLPQQSLIKGDQKSLSIAASSVLAKVTRDRYMADLSNRYPEYGFERHVGYGTEEHLAALNAHGITPEHRRSFRPVQETAATRQTS